MSDIPEIWHDGMTHADKVDLVRRTVAPDLTNNELDLFLITCQRLRLDPFTRQIYAIKRKGKMTIQIGIDGMRAIAEDSEQYLGQEGPYWCGPDSKWRDVWLGDGPPAASKVVVLRHRGASGVAKCIGVASWDSYAQKGADGSLSNMWARMGPEMLAKCAESLALRKAFPRSLSGLYSDAEMDQAGDPSYSLQRFNQPPYQSGLKQAPILPSDGLAPLALTGNARGPLDGEIGPSHGTTASPTAVQSAQGFLARKIGSLSPTERDRVASMGDKLGLPKSDDTELTAEGVNKYLALIRGLDHAEREN